MSPSAPPKDPSEQAIVILGCRFTEVGPGPALHRRLLKGLELARAQERPCVVVMSGGAGSSRTEANVMATWWTQQNGPASLLLLEQRSQNTRQNAEQTERLLRAHDIRRVALVTCDSHLPRALREFARVGLIAQGHAAPSGHGTFRRARARVREWFARWLTSFLGLALCVVAPSFIACQPQKSESLERSPPAARRALSLALGADALAPLAQAAREPLSSDRERFARALLETGPARRWGAFGLGQLCAEPGLKDMAGAPAIDALLETSAAIWALDSSPPSGDDLEAIALALGSCATERAERTLRIWLEAPRNAKLPDAGEAAALGLGRIANRRGTLQERTLAVLLDRASAEKNARFLYPIGRIAELPRAVAERTLDVAGKVLVEKTPLSRRDAIFALGSAGPRGRGALGATALTKTYRLNERTAALQTLVRFGSSGQEKLDELSLALLEQGIPKKASDPAWIVLFAALHALERAKVSSDALDLIRKGPVPAPPPDTSRESRALAAQRRRIIALRCRAAEIQAGSDWSHKLLRTCDPDAGPTGKLALLRALDHVVLGDAAANEILTLTDDLDVQVRIAALNVIAGHREFKDGPSILLREARSGGTEAKQVALRAITAHPERFMEAESNGSAFVLEMLSRDATEPQLTMLALGAAGALGAPSLKPSVEPYCTATGPSAYVLGRAARRALALLGDSSRSCERRTLHVQQAPVQKATVSMMSDLGPVSLSFSAPDAPFASAKILGLLTSGTSAPSAIRATREAFLLEWAPAASAASPDPVLPSELDWRAPREGEFGVGSSWAQSGALLFFSLSSAPELAGQKTILGTFSGAFELLVPGDRIDQIEISREP